MPCREIPISSGSSSTGWMTIANDRIKVDKLPIAGAVLAGLGVFAYFASAHVHFPGDPGVSSWVQSWHSGALDSTMDVFAALAHVEVAGPIMLAVTVVLFFALGRFAALVFLGSTVAGYALALAVKELVARPRPTEDLVLILQEAGGHSFPSTTATLYTALIGTLLVIVGARAGRSMAGRGAQLALVALLLFIGFSRIYIGAHWLSDVIGGYALGGAVVVAAAWVMRRPGFSGRSLCGR